MALKRAPVFGTEMDAKEEKRTVSKAEQFRQKRRCDSITAPTEYDIAILEENLGRVDGLNTPQGLGTISSPTGLGEVTTVVFSLKNQVGCLVRALHMFQEHNINVVHIESRKSRTCDTDLDFYVDLETDKLRLQELIRRLRKQISNISLHQCPFPQSPVINSEDTLDLLANSPWFPKTIADLDISANRVLMYGKELDADHPGFKDKVYRQRRDFFSQIAMEYKYGEPIPRIEYTEEEVRTWGVVFGELLKLYPTHACREYLRNLPALAEQCGFRVDNMPQLEDVSQFLKARTGFQLRPVAGYLSSRDFLAGLAFRVFHCTQYIRHSTQPLYTPEPDSCHDLIGHVPLLADPSFAQFSQEIGLASLGTSNEEVQKLATCYFFTIEFGLCKQHGELRAYGAGLLSSFGEIQHALSDKATKIAFEPARASQQECLITTYQDVYFYTESFEEAKERMRQFAATIKRPFAVRYNPYTQSVEILDNTHCIASVVAELKGDLCIVSDALRRLQLIEKENEPQTPITNANFQPTTVDSIRQ